MRHACNVALLGSILLTSQLALADDPAPADPVGPPAPAVVEGAHDVPAPATPPAEDPSADRPSMRWNAQPDRTPPPPDAPVNPFAPVSFDSNGVPLRVRMEKADGAPSQFACTTPCSLTVPLGTYFLHTEGEGLRTYDSSIEIRPNGFKMTLGAGRKKDFAWSVALMSVAAASIVGWSAVWVPQFADGAQDPWENGAFVGTLIGVGVVAVAGFTVGGYLLNKSAKGPISIRPGLDPRSSTSSAFASPFRFTF